MAGRGSNPILKSLRTDHEGLGNPLQLFILVKGEGVEAMYPGYNGV